MSLLFILAGVLVSACSPSGSFDRTCGNEGSFLYSSFRAKVDKAIQQIKTLLDTTRNPQLADGVDHDYHNKFHLAEYVSNAGIACAFDGLKELGLDSSAFAKAKRWREHNCSVWLEFRHNQTCTFDREVSRDVDSAQKTVTTSNWGTSSTRKVVTTVTDYFWTFTNAWELRLVPGSGCAAAEVEKNSDQSSLQLQGRKAVLELRTATKKSPHDAAKTWPDVAHDLTWLLDLTTTSSDGPVPVFKIDRLHTTCKTPRRNQEVRKVFESSVQLLQFARLVQERFRDFMLIEQTARELKGDPRFHIEDIELDPSTMKWQHRDDIFIPVLPLLEDRLASLNLTVLSKEDRQILQQGHVKSLQNVLDRIAATFPGAKEETAKLISAQEVKTVVVCSHLATLVEIHWLPSLDFIEEMLTKQLVAAIGKEVTVDDFTAYMDYYQQRFFAPNHVPKPFVYAIRRPKHYPEGTVSIERSGHGHLPSATDAANAPILSFTSLANPPNHSKPIQFAIDAATKVSFNGPRYLHALMMQSFSGAVPESLQLVARARQFSCFILLLGTLSVGNAFEPKHGIIVQNKGEAIIPLLLEPIPSAKAFKDAIASLSPEQQSFAKAFRAMQLSNTVFGLCVVQIKPQLELLLQLDADSLTKEIALTQLLLDLFLNYQIPSDLLSYDGPMDAPSAAKIQRVQELAKNMQDMLDSASDRELKEAKARATKEQPLKQPLEGELKEAKARATKEQPLNQPLEGDGPTARIFRAASMARMAYMPAPMVMTDSAESVKEMHTMGEMPAPLQFNRINLEAHTTTQAGESSQDGPVSDEATQGERGGPSESCTKGEVCHGEYTSIPHKLDQALLAADKEGEIRPTKLKTGERWTVKSSKGLLSPPEINTRFEQQEQRGSKARTFDLLDALSRSGELPLTEAQLHVILAVTHTFDRTLMETVIQENRNPIEALEHSMLVVASTVVGQSAETLVHPEHLNRVKQSLPDLFVDAARGDAPQQSEAVTA